jgi:hypothetical protein
MLPHQLQAVVLLLPSLIDTQVSELYTSMQRRPTPAPVNLLT